MTGVSKAYGNTVALDNVSLELLPGQVHGLMGENGAGKSTLMKILAGVVHPDAGAVLKNGTPVQLRNPREALECGISTVFQELSLLPNLSIAENMFLGKEPVSAVRGLDRRAMEQRTAAALGELGLRLSPSTLVSRLTVAEQQFVEIARGISANADVVILDEPTAALNAADVGVLKRHIARLKADGKAIVYISHRMEEIFEICDAVTVLKDGRKVGSRSIDELTPQSLIAMMVGREIGDLFPPRAASMGSKPVLRLQGLQLSESSQPIDLTLHAGEIVALAGLEGQGQREIVRSIIGRHQPQTGEMTIRGRRIALPVGEVGGVRKLQALGVAFVPEDRKDEGLFLGLSVDHNLAIGLQAARAAFKPQGNFRDKVEEIVRRMAIKARTIAMPVGALSGGNQQKALLGRYLLLGAEILLIEEPTRGVDVGAKLEIYRLLREFVERGGAVLVLSRETVELIGISDRMYVIHGQRVVREMRGADATEHDIVDAAMTTQRSTTKSPKEPAYA
ncbi:monosaccharide ABC transporter ATP-binding protein, CUT2 family [Variovorax sp. YR750]|nr:monosaccharide ABC transporter ATP-binding protein, CUT2 family [Variovorax sp. YR750]